MGEALSSGGINIVSIITSQTCINLLLDAFPATTNRLQVREQRFPEERNGRPAPAEEAHP